jgi:hypothetical protein
LISNLKVNGVGAPRIINMSFTGEVKRDESFWEGA